MKKIIFFLFLLNYGFVVSAQDEPAYICRHGFTFEISAQKTWGYNKPVVLTVTPNTSADANGIKANDIIEKIDGKNTDGHTIETITDWLQDSPERQLTLTISNLKEGSKVVTLTKQCTLANAITEKDLASVYSFYSLEDSQNQTFTCPFKTNATPGVNFKSYKTFGFAPIGENNRELEEIINSAIRTSLEEKGLKYERKNPDLIINTYYSYKKNLNYNKNDNAGKLPTEIRYNVVARKMVSLPVYYNPLINSKQAEYFLNLGIRFIDQKLSTGDKAIVVWECEANELIQSGNYTLDKYAVFHIPLMLMQYPYTKSNETVTFHYAHLRHNYTGINYNIDKLNEIADIDRLSPASNVDLQVGDKILKINEIKFIDNPKSAAKKYKQFIFNTMDLRDPKTQYTNTAGFTKCMFWDKFQYAEVYREFMKSDYNTTFSYLFYFEPYINLSGTNIITFLVERDKQKIEVKIKPSIITEDIFESIN
ncbi:MAG: DUF4136 domain-containing protein [Dysgonamonadaceae bacterium]|jgi:hypothetical protein|nr:DUF4136 domain-containing protein [Dysgonamonadaceae bacterium]